MVRRSKTRRSNTNTGVTNIQKKILKILKSYKEEVKQKVKQDCNSPHSFPPESTQNPFEAQPIKEQRYYLIAAHITNREDFFLFLFLFF